MKELQGIVKHCHENISGKKADLLMRTSAIFSHCQQKLQSQQLSSDSFMDHTTCCTYKAVFSCELSNTIWKNDIREIKNFNFFQLYHYFVVITEKYNGNLLRRTSYKRLKSFQFFYEGHIKTMELCTTELFIHVHSKVKPSMKNKCYVIIKFIRELEDIMTAACTCPAGSSIKCLGKCNHVGAILFALEDFNRKNLKTFAEPLTCTSQLSKWNVRRDSSTNPAPIDKTLVKKNKYGDNPSTEVEPKNNCYDTRSPNGKYLDNDSMNTLKRDLQKCLPSSAFSLFHDIESKCSKNCEKEEIECEVVELDHVYESNHDTDFTIETVDNFPLPFNEFYDISKDSFKDMVDKCCQYFIN